MSPGEDLAPLSGEALEARWGGSNCHLLPVCENRVFLHWPKDQPRALTPSYQEAGELITHARSPVWIHSAQGRDFFAVELDRFQPKRRIPGGDFEDLRSVAGLLSDPDWSLLARAKAMIQWHASHTFCTRCGAPSGRSPGGLARYCSNPECGQRHFPRTDPAVIVRVVQGDRILLGRQPNWPRTRRSVLAGFVSPGESAEATVVREVFEEAGIRIRPDSVRYFSSQPWPFPGSLMLAYTAEAGNTDIQRLDGELADAEWWSRPALNEALAEEAIQLPNTRSVARHLIEDWRSTD
ncbi:NAD+ diphosphatase [Natronospira proteinivora]|uniref:NAD(+) diphosphatase n=1 Tax=Natronospira proteinivora TaxID=1807133 RepID=A0ABT1GAA9_9GAMM|nr:NAD(+) diphosphatase [Natronospira proteinivora]MCP1728264.1 NAD+ diphosphatase [Natronospira proteinivora]